MTSGRHRSGLWAAASRSPTCIRIGVIGLRSSCAAIARKSSRARNSASNLETRLASARLEVKADHSRLVTAQAAVVAQRIATTAGTLVQSVERFELTATRLIEKTRDAFRDAEGLIQTRAGRARTIVKDAFSLHARRTSMASTEDTSIDGNKILLG